MSVVGFLATIVGLVLLIIIAAAVIATGGFFLLGCYFLIIEWIDEKFNLF